MLIFALALGAFCALPLLGVNMSGLAKEVDRETIARAAEVERRR